MNQYRTGSTTQVLNKAGDVVDITLFRNRIAYPADYIISDKVGQSNFNRPDILTLNIYGSFDAIGAMIDTNEKDVFDFSVGDTYNYPLPEVASV